MTNPSDMEGSGLQVQVVLKRPEFTLDVTLNLPGQGITAIFGVSGSGKTTLLRVLAGLEPQTMTSSACMARSGRTVRRACFGPCTSGVWVMYFRKRACLIT